MSNTVLIKTARECSETLRPRQHQHDGAWIVLVMQTDIGGDIIGATGLGGVESDLVPTFAMFAAFSILQGPPAFRAEH